MDGRWLESKFGRNRAALFVGVAEAGDRAEKRVALPTHYLFGAIPLRRERLDSAARCRFHAKAEAASLGGSLVEVRLSAVAAQ
jgi:hypothetical protein